MNMFTNVVHKSRKVYGCRAGTTWQYLSVIRTVQTCFGWYTFIPSLFPHSTTLSPIFISLKFKLLKNVLNGSNPELPYRHPTNLSSSYDLYLYHHSLNNMLLVPSSPIKAHILPFPACEPFSLYQNWPLKLLSLLSYYPQNKTSLTSLPSVF